MVTDAGALRPSNRLLYAACYPPTEMQRLQRLRGTYGWRTLGPDAPLWALLLPPVAFAAAALQMALSPVDPDYWWHLTTGRWMLDHGRVPFTDPFSVSHGGQTWYAHEWLTELIFAITDKIGGYALNIVLTALVVAAGAWFLGRACRLYGSGTLLALLLVLGGSFFILGFVAVRPQVWGWALLALVLHEICAHDVCKRTLWRLPFIFVLWVNIHLSVELGALALALYGLHRGLRWLLALRRPEHTPADGISPSSDEAVADPVPLGPPPGPLPPAGVRGSLLSRFGLQKHRSTLRLSAERSGAGGGPGGGPAQPSRYEFDRFRTTILVGLASAVALCVNPRGPLLLWFSRVYANPNAERWQYIGEWQKPVFQGDERYLFIAGGIVLVLTLLALFTRRALWPGILALIFGASALRANRYSPDFGIAGIVVAGWLIARFNGRNVGLRAVRFAPLLFGLLCAGAVICIAIGAWASGPTQFRRVADARPGPYPVAAVAYVKQNLPNGGVISEYGWGGYLIYSFYPRARVYMDGREEMYGETFFKSYVQTMAGQGDWQQRLQADNVDVAILQPHEGLAVAMSQADNWRQLFQDDVAVVYERVPPDTGSLPTAPAPDAAARR